MIHSYVLAFALNVCKTSLFKTIVFSIRDMKFLADITESEPNKRLKSVRVLLYHNYIEINTIT